MKRRKFIQISSTGSLAGFMLNGHLVNAFTRTKLLNNVSEDVIRDRSMVMIQLSGGNDGLNSWSNFTLSPLSLIHSCNKASKCSVTGCCPSDGIVL